MSTNTFFEAIAQMKTGFFLIAYLCLEYPSVFALEVMGFAIGMPIKILKALIVKTVNLAIWHVTKIQLVLLECKVSMDNELVRTMNSINTNNENLELYDYDYPDILIFLKLLLKYLFITTFLSFHGICTDVFRMYYFTLRKILYVVQ